ncbi:hypothetical protein MRS44_017143 [Fusarium solani]|uniref:uncharacterized protein n=1 Tax=Fusarium solani TaxID=169388 RepID=UPI0032C440DB|nr:hypothetical protein MRS44_017143 [Fusarium solani]
MSKIWLRPLADRDAPPVGKRWASNFVERQPELKTRSFRKYDYKRAKCEDPEIIRGWFILVENTTAKYGIAESDIYKFDETGFIMGVVSTARQSGMDGSKESITEKNVRGGFQGTGLVPLDPESVISKLDVKLRTPTPVEGADELLAPPAWGGGQ